MTWNISSITSTFILIKNLGFLLLYGYLFICGKPTPVVVFLLYDLPHRVLGGLSWPSFPPECTGLDMLPQVHIFVLDRCSILCGSYVSKRSISDNSLSTALLVQLPKSSLPFFRLYWFAKITPSGWEWIFTGDKSDGGGAFSSDIRLMTPLLAP